MDFLIGRDRALPCLYMVHLWQLYDKPLKNAEVLWYIF